MAQLVDAGFVVFKYFCLQFVNLGALIINHHDITQLSGEMSFYLAYLTQP